MQISVEWTQQTNGRPLPRKGDLIAIVVAMGATYGVVMVEDGFKEVRLCDLRRSS
jgi:hypothetical protein